MHTADSNLGELHYHPRAMGTNCAAIHVKLTPKLRRADIARAAADWYASVGATRGPDAWSSTYKPLALSEAKRGKGSLGVAIGAANKSWVQVIDSERYTVDAALARHLATSLRTTVFWKATSDASNSRMIVRFGKACDWEACATRSTSDYYDQLDGSDEWSYLRFDNVPYGKYEATPSEAPRADLTCAHCGANREYLLGADTRLQADIGLPLAEAPAPSKRDGELLLGAECCRCGAQVAAWMAARWEGNLIVSLRPLASFPARRAKYFYQWPVPKPAPKRLAGLKPADVTLANNPYWLRVKYKGVEQMLRWTGKEPVTGKRVLVALTSAGKIYQVQYTRADGSDETVDI